MVVLKGDKEIGDKINKIVAKLAEANELKGTIDIADFNDEAKLGKGKEMVDRLSNLVSIFNMPALNFSSNGSDGDDLLGDAYEYLMRQFATDSGKSKGQFYTPAEVSRVLAKVIGIDAATSTDQTIYDPTCGSGSLLLKAHDEAEYLTGLDLAIYGQEMDNATAGLAKMNTILHDCPTSEIWQDNTLASPYFKESDGGLKRFDFAVANPPFSYKAWSNGLDPENDLYNRFEYGIPPAKNGDYAFLLHIIASLKSSGKGAVILPHGVLFRGNVEADIRKKILQQGFIKGIIGLPPNLFYGTGIPACIVVIDKENANDRNGVFMIDASRGFMKDGNKNRLRDRDIHKIVDTFTNQLEISKYSRMVPFAEIEGNDYNLNIPRYIDSSEPEDLQDINAHLMGGIPNRDIDAFERYWQVFPTLKGQLFTASDRQEYSNLAVAPNEIKSTIYQHPEFTAFNDRVMALFDRWQESNIAKLQNIEIGSKPKALLGELSEDLLETFQGAELLDAYDIYQHLMDYWAETMQDDVYAIAADGWIEAAKLREIKDKEKPDFEIDNHKFKAELVPKTLVINRFFAAEQADIDKLEAHGSAIAQSLEELVEEHGGEEGYLNEISSKKEAEQALEVAHLSVWKVLDSANCEKYNHIVVSQNELLAKLEEVQENSYLKALADTKGKITQKNIKARLKNNLDKAEKEALDAHQDLYSRNSKLKKQAKILKESAIKLIEEKLVQEPEHEDLQDIQVLQQYLSVSEQISEQDKLIKAEIKKLEQSVFEKYWDLSLEDIRSLVIYDKWLAHLATTIAGEVERVSQALAGRIKTLGDRYAVTLPQIVDEVAELSARVDEHLKRMGVNYG
jgi:type I restriction enzyme M protein